MLPEGPNPYITQLRTGQVTHEDLAAQLRELYQDLKDAARSTRSERRDVQRTLSWVQDALSWHMEALELEHG